MSQGPHDIDPSPAPGPLGATPQQASLLDDAISDEIDAPEPSGDLEEEDSFDEFEAYAKMAAGARIKGVAKSPDAMKMRGNRDAGAGRKFNKPAHKDKRGP